MHIVDITKQMLHKTKEKKDKMDGYGCSKKESLSVTTNWYSKFQWPFSVVSTSAEHLYAALFETYEL